MDRATSLERPNIRPYKIASRISGLIVNRHKQAKSWLNFFISSSVIVAVALRLFVRVIFSSFTLAACTTGPVLTSTPTVTTVVEVPSATPAVVPAKTNPAIVPSATHTVIPTSTATVIQPTQTATSRPTLAASATTKPSSTPETVTCPVMPEGNFASIWQNDAVLQAGLGCPSSGHPRIEPAAWEVATSYQAFEGGLMIWSDHIGWYAQPVIYILYNNGSYQRFEDTFDGAVDPFNGNETPPNGLIEPSLGFGKVWRIQPGVRDGLGWATAAEATGVGRFELFQRGEMIWISQTNQTYIFTNSNGQFVTVAIPFQ